MSFDENGGNEALRDGMSRAVAILIGSGAILWLLIASTACLAQAPAWSRGFQLLPIRVSEASRRAEAGLRAEGYTETNHSNPSEDAWYCGGQKGASAAVIMCDQAPNNGGTWINIVVSTANTTNNGIPGLERQKLQARMNSPVPATPPSKPPAGAIPGTWVYHDNDSGYAIAQTFAADGTIRATDGAHGTWRIVGNQLITKWENGWSNTLQLPAVANKLTGIATGPGNERHSITLTRQ
ncbi:MAG TPA: hypothetical protein VKT77_10620 [Chthonomonadaceae bacterium]|nr:hypothetical protein [Chthonomonadaceae bacterium]